MSPSCVLAVKSTRVDGVFVALDFPDGIPSPEIADNDLAEALEAKADEMAMAAWDSLQMARFRVRFPVGSHCVAVWISVSSQMLGFPEAVARLLVREAIKHGREAAAGELGRMKGQGWAQGPVPGLS